VQNGEPQKPLVSASSNGSSSNEQSRLPNSPVEVVGYECYRCKDLGWVYRDVKNNHPEFGKPFRCECKQGSDTAKRRRYLLGIDGLTAEDRRKAFEDFQVTPGNREAYYTIVDGLVKRRGFITLEGAWGLGKTELLICAVNKARDAGIPAVYTTTAALLDYLRQAYKPGVELDVDQRWDLLTSVEVLAVDELEKFSATEWALERFSRLVDERWRRMGKCLTLFATNARIETLPGDVRSRMEDGRAEIITLAGADMRKFSEWDDVAVDMPFEMELA
jgi:DNA replication protein DnaC